MYRVPKAVKSDPVRRWNLPDRVFFACGACHILAVSGERAFDFHGHSHWPSLLDHARRKADRWWPGWHCDLVALPLDVLVSEEKSRCYDGLWLREPGQYLHDAHERAKGFLDRFPPL